MDVKIVKRKVRLMKLISIAVPAYNSENYLNKSIDSLLVGGEDVEIIIVNDGSTDNTDKIAREYLAKYPSIIKYVDKENGGHGDAVCAGLAVATGKYFKVCDSDDWFGAEAFKKLIAEIKASSNENIDLYISNFIYDKVGAKRKKTMAYHKSLTANQTMEWSDFKLKYGKYLLMHSVIYRTQLLRDAKIALPKHTFYVDNIFVFQPLPYVERLYYIDVDLYHYFIGRDDQSVNEQIMMKRIDQQILVNKLMIDYFNDTDNLNKQVSKYMLSYLQIMMTISTILLIRIGTKEAQSKTRELWKYLKNEDPNAYLRIRTSLQGNLLNLPRSMNWLKVLIYKIYKKIWGFN